MSAPIRITAQEEYAMVKVFCGGWGHGRKWGRKERKTRRTVILEELFDEVDVGQHHSPTAVPLKLQSIQCITASRNEY